MKKGLVHIYYGDGKGKTTCAAGLSIRCAGHNGKVLWFQFLKTDSSGERRSLEKLDNVELVSGYSEMKFTFKMSQEEKAQARNFFVNKFNEIIEKVMRENYDLLVLDEIIDAVSTDMLDEEDIINFLESKPDGLEVVLTGHNPSQTLCKYADYITKMEKVKHPYDEGILARDKIEY